MARSAVGVETARGSIYARACAWVGEAIAFDIQDRQRPRPSARTAAADAANSSPGRGGTHRLCVADHARGLGFNEALERLAIPEFDAVRCRNGDDILAPEGR